MEKNQEIWREWRKHIEEKPAIQKLRQSPQFGEVLRLLSRHETKGVRPGGLDTFVYGLVVRALDGPDISERMTRTERNKLSAMIVEAASGLSEMLELLSADDGMPFEFQALFDGFALDVADSYAESLEVVELELDDETAHRCRYAVYHLLMEGVPDFLQLIAEGAKYWAASERVLKKPNDPNAERLYFIRILTRQFCMEFGTPMRAATIALTSVFFNCDDIDEAALSRLAPPWKPHPRPSGP